MYKKKSYKKSLKRKNQKQEEDTMKIYITFSENNFPLIFKHVI